MEAVANTTHASGETRVNIFVLFAMGLQHHSARWVAFMRLKFQAKAAARHIAGAIHVNITSKRRQLVTAATRRTLIYVYHRKRRNVKPYPTATCSMEPTSSTTTRRLYEEHVFALEYEFRTKSHNGGKRKVILFIFSSCRSELRGHDRMSIAKVAILLVEFE